jgi:chemosensory pili system protein ChpA (sensor histidine kinase/response regulator)
MVKLHPQSSALAQALTAVIDATLHSGEAPAPTVAMEVATSILYLEAAYEDLDPTDDHMAERSARLAKRLQLVLQGAEPEPLEAWMEELYRRVSERQTMGSVVDELRTTLSEAETSLDQFFRNPDDKSPLREVPNRLSQMRGVFSVLGMDQPALACMRMRSSVELLLVDEVDVELARAGVFERLGNSLGALGLLIDMLSYQRAMAKMLFVYDEEAGEFKPLMGRERSAAPALEAAAVPSPVPLPQVAPPEVVAASEDDEEDLQGIFLEEAREVILTGLTAARELAADPSNLAEQTTVRRAFHTLKGSARMVGLNEFGEAAWACEQMLNAWLAEQQPASDGLISLSASALSALGRWVEDIAGNTGVHWSAAPFRASADAQRLSGQALPLKVPGAEPDLPQADAFEGADTVFLDSVQPQETETAAQPLGARDEPMLDFANTHMSGLQVLEATPYTPAFEPVPAPPMESDSVLPDFESTQVVEVSGLPAEAAALAEPASAELVDLVELDFSDMVAPTTEVDAEPLSETTDTADTTELIDTSELDEVLALDEAHDPAPAEPAEEQVKVIGDLRLGIPLYNVFLNEADEWSRRLQVELSEWALELHRPIADSTVGLAHSLGGIAATVGFGALSELGRTLEHALEHVKLHEQGNAQHAQVFNEAAEEIRRLLHQFAAGFLKTCDASLLQQLRDIVAAAFDAPTLLPEDEALPYPVAMAPDLPDLSEVQAVQDVHAVQAVQAFPVVQAQPAALPVLDGSDIDATDHLDTDLYPIFQEEALELMPALGTALRQWVARPDNLGARAEALRVLHTLKGSARLAGAMRLGEMAHRMESGVESLGTENLTTPLLEPLLGQLDALQATLDALDLAPREDISQPLVEAVTAADAELPEAAASEIAAALASPVAMAAPASVQRSENRNLPQPVRSAAGQSVRVRTQLLDRLVNQAGEVMMSRSRLDDRVMQMRSGLGEFTGNLERLRQQLRDVELQAESQMQSRLAHTKEDAQPFDPLEFDRFTRVQELTRMMAESVNDVATVQRNLQRALEGAEDDLNAQARQARELQRDLLRTRMVEFDGIADRLYGVVRQAAKEAGKQVRLDIVGGTIEMDRGVLDRMTPAFEHMLRNAVGHGIEDPATRTAAGKPATGAITITVNQESNDVSVTFSDDGAGLQLDTIRAKAIERQLIAPDAEFNTEVAAQLLFAPGFSTASEVTELSGRGIGMDVVLTELNALGGVIHTQSAPGEGTTFRMVLPLTTAVTQVVMLRMGELTFGVPSNLVETVLRAPQNDLQAAYQHGSFGWAGHDVPFYWGGALLQTSGRSAEVQGRTLPVAILRSAGQRLALHVDEVLGNREVVVKNLGPQLARLPGLAGMSVLASGAVVLIYNPVALATVYGAQARALMAQASPDYSAAGTASTAPTATPLISTQAPLVLVVDDSITVRRVTQRLLKREGYRVSLANDGLHALEMLAQEKPMVVLSDIEMPRMDGFDLVRNIRNDARLRDLPVIMITSRIAQKHRDHAMELGVDHYLGKPYSEEELLALVRSYCTEAVDA